MLPLFGLFCPEILTAGFFTSYREYECAEPDFLATIKLDPTDADNQAGYAQALSGQGRFAEAVKQFGVALRLPAAHQDILLARLIDLEIDDTFVQVGVLSPDCKTDHGRCVLPDDLKPKAPTGSPAYVSVSYWSAPAARALDDVGKAAFDQSPVPVAQ